MADDLPPGFEVIGGPDALPPGFSVIKPGNAATAAAPKESTASDVGKSFGSGIVRGLAETAMLPVTIGRVGEKAGNWVWDKGEDAIRVALGLPPADPVLKQKIADARAASPAGKFDAALFGGQDSVRGAMDDTLHAPQSKAGQYAETIGEFVQPGMLRTAAEKGIGAAARHFVAEAAVPGAASETAGELTEGTRLEPYARVLGAVLGNAAVVLPKTMNTPEAVVRRALGPAENIDWDRAARLQNNSTGITLSGPEAVAHAQNGTTGLPDLLRVVEGSPAGRQKVAPFFSARQGQVDNAVGSLLDAIFSQSAKPSELGPTISKAAELALKKGPEGQAVADAVYAAGPRMTDMEAGSVIQPELHKVFQGRDNMRDALADQAYDAARRSAPTIPVDDLPVTPTVRNPSYTRLDPGENILTGAPQMQPTGVPADIQTPSLVSRTGPDLIQVDPRKVLQTIDRLNVDARAGTQDALQSVRSMLFRDGGADTSVSGLEKTRGAVGDLITAAKQGGQMQQVEYLREVQRSLDDALSSVPEYAKANDLYNAASAPLAPFQNTAAGKVIARDEFNSRFLMNPENVPSSLSAPSELRNFGSVASPQAREAMGANITTRLLDAATDASGNVSLDKLRTAIRDNEDVLNQMPDVRDRLLQIADKAEAFDAARAGSQLGRVAAADTTEAAGAAILPQRPLVGSEAEAADTVRRLVAENPEATAQIVRQELAQRYAQAAKDTQAGSHEAAGIKFRNSIAGSAPQDAVLRAVLGNLPSQEAMKAAPELLDVLHATGQRKAIGSATDFNAAIRGDLSVNSPAQRFGDMLRSLGSTFVTNAADTARRAAYGKSLDSLADLFTAPNSVELIKEAVERTAKSGLEEVARRSARQAPVATQGHR
ncbi:hypothetical protein [Oryzifoliimicrobium ureilyticus]|uniref:hypothetical protein n=1 Tax=Oryzifoliimicrobium ureilyticus TaxID=3113724 RepID=UPI0030762827